MSRIISAFLCALVALPALAEEAAAPPDAAELQKALEQAVAQQKAQREEFAKAIGLRSGPLDGDMGVATIKVPEGFVFTDGAGAKKWAQLTTNPVSDKEIGLTGPESNAWLVLFEYDAIGYVKDDEKDDLDAEDLLEQIKEGTDAFNAEREKAGVAPLNLVGWEVKPHYNEATKQLEWCVRMESEGEPVLNYNTRILGREGVVSVTLMFGGETQLTELLPEFRTFVGAFAFKPGNTYAEYKDGDRIAEIGLGALIAGGSLAVAAKTGLLAKLGLLLAKGGKLIVVGVLAVVGGIASLGKKLFGKKDV